jgi:hypothetical protein
MIRGSAAREVLQQVRLRALVEAVNLPGISAWGYAAGLQLGWAELLVVVVPARSERWEIQKVSCNGDAASFLPNPLSSIA